MIQRCFIALPSPINIIYIYIYTYIHTHTHTHIYMCVYWVLCRSCHFQYDEGCSLIWSFQCLQVHLPPVIDSPVRTQQFQSDPWIYVLFNPVVSWKTLLWSLSIYREISIDLLSSKRGALKSCLLHAHCYKLAQVIALCNAEQYYLFQIQFEGLYCTYSSFRGFIRGFIYIYRYIYLYIYYA